MLGYEEDLLAALDRIPMLRWGVTLLQHEVEEPRSQSNSCIHREETVQLTSLVLLLFSDQ